MKISAPNFCIQSFGAYANVWLYYVCRLAMRWYADARGNLHVSIIKAYLLATQRLVQTS
jgi:hypothetical protein